MWNYQKHTKLKRKYTYKKKLSNSERVPQKKGGNRIHSNTAKKFLVSLYWKKKKRLNKHNKSTWNLN